MDDREQKIEQESRLRNALDSAVWGLLDLGWEPDDIRDTVDQSMEDHEDA